MTNFVIYESARMYGFKKVTMKYAKGAKIYDNGVEMIVRANVSLEVEEKEAVQAMHFLFGKVRKLNVSFEKKMEILLGTANKLNAQFA